MLNLKLYIHGIFNEFFFIWIDIYYKMECLSFLFNL
jgi:hypothetical protein